MPQLRTKQELATIARAFALSYQLVEYRDELYMPVDFETMEPKPSEPSRTIWIELNKRKFRGVANVLLNILFANPAEEQSFKHMTLQMSTPVDSSIGVLFRGEGSVQILNKDGSLSKSTGEFMPNYLNIQYDPKAALKDELFEYMTSWVDGSDQAESLLRHMSTILQPTWSAGKYVMLIGERGSNGKSTLLKMLLPLLGQDNISGVTRQKMAASSPIVKSVNGKLLNMVIDGPKEFVKDSSVEKTLVMGEPLWLEMKYENVPELVQTNALFMEGLNYEPVNGDKSGALQRRLVRYHFPNQYQRDLSLERKFQSKEMQMALLALMIDHWTDEESAGQALAVTAKSLDLQMQAVWSNSPVLRFLEAMSLKDLRFVKSVTEGQFLDEFIPPYRLWMEANGYKNIEDDYIVRQLSDYFILDRKTARVNGRPVSRRYFKSILPATQNALNVILEAALKEESDILSD